MMLVVDASVAVKWLFSEPLSDRADELLRPGRELLAPDLVWAEVANAACKKVLRKEIEPDKAAELLKDLFRLPIKIFSCKPMMPVAWSVALEAGLSVYDCLYLALSYKRDCSLVTADRKFYDKIRVVYPQSEILWLADFKA